MGAPPVSTPQAGLYAPRAVEQEEDDDLDFVPTGKAPKASGPRTIDYCEPSRRTNFTERAVELEARHRDSLWVSKVTVSVGAPLAGVGGLLMLAAGVGWIPGAGMAIGAVIGGFGLVMCLISLLNWLSELVNHPTALENHEKDKANDLQQCGPLKTERPKATDPKNALAPRS